MSEDMNEILKQAAAQNDDTGRAARWWQEQIRQSTKITEDGVVCHHTTMAVTAGQSHPFVCLACGAKFKKDPHDGYHLRTP